MELGTIAQLATAGAVFVALAFGVVQVRQFHRARRDATTFQFINSFQSPHFLRNLRIVLDLPDNAPAESVRGHHEVQTAADELSLLFEGMGYMVHEKLLPLATLDELVGGAVRSCHRKLEPYIMWLRSERSPTYYEWFTWLRDQLRTHGRLDRERPAHEVYARWNP